MEENGKINPFQFFILVFHFTIGNTIINAPNIIVGQAKQDAWLSSILALGFGLCLVLLYCYLADHFPDKTIVEFNEVLLGKFLGKTMSAFLLMYFFVIGSLMLRQLGTFVRTFTLPETPRIPVYLLFLGILLLATYLGLEPIARTAEIFAPLVLFLLLFVFISLTAEVDFQNVKPYFENGWKPVAKGTLNFISIPYLQSIVLLMLYPYIEKKEKARKAFFIGVGLAGVFLVCSIVYTLLILGVSLTEFKQYPTYTLAEKISIANIIERVEVIVAFLWFVTIFFKTTILFYATNIGLKQLLHLQSDKLLIFPLGFLFLMLTFYNAPNVMYFNAFFQEIMPFFTLTFGLFVPLLLLVIAVWQRKKEKKENTEVDSRPS